MNWYELIKEVCFWYVVLSFLTVIPVLIWIGRSWDLMTPEQEKALWSSQKGMDEFDNINCI